MKTKIAIALLKTLSNELLLLDWTRLNKFLMTSEATEARVSKLLALEIRGRCRTSIIFRLHARFNKLRGNRERRKLLHD